MKDLACRLVAGTLFFFAAASSTASQSQFLAEGRPTATYALGENLELEVLDPLADDPAAIDTIFATVSSVVSGDSETIALTETDYDSGLFRGLLPSRNAPTSPGDGELSVTFGETVTADVGSPPAEVTIAGSRTLTIDASGQPADVFLEGSRIYVRVIDSEANSDPSFPNHASARIEAQLSGDRETIHLAETGPDTSTFEGSLELSLAPPSAGNGIVETTGSAGPPGALDTLKTTHDDSESSSTATANLLGSRTSFLDPQGLETSAYARGTTLYLRVEAPSRDTPGVWDTAVLELRGSGGDEEDLLLLETSRSSGVFEGSIDHDALGPVSLYDGRFQADVGETLTATHPDVLGFTHSSASATVVLSTIEFFDADGLPTAELLESGTARVRVFSLGAGVSPVALDEIFVDLASDYGGDSEALRLVETEVDSDVYEGGIPLRFTASGSAGDGLLDTFNSAFPAFRPDQVTATWRPPGLPESVAEVSAAVRGARLVFLDPFRRPTDHYALGEEIRVRVEDHNRNLSPAQIDTVTLTLTSAGTLDSESLALTETDFDTGIYEGSLPSTTDPTPGDGALGTAIHQTITAHHLPLDAVNEAQAAALITGSTTTFIDAAGQPAEVYLESSRLYVRVFDSEANFSPSFADSTQVRIDALLTGDSESFHLTETGPDTNVFEGSFDLSLDPPSSGNGVVETTESAGPPFEFETLTATHDDSEGSSSDTATTLGSRTYFVDALGRRVMVYPRGGTVRVRVEAPNRNAPGVWDTAPVTLRNPGSGDEEDLLLLETSRSSGVFEGTIPLDSSGSTALFDSLLQADSGDVLTATHPDVLGLTESSSAAQVQPSAIDFIDAAGEPTEELTESGTARLRVFSLGAGVSAAIADEISIDLESFYGGDSETLRLVETGADTDVFEGEMTTRFASPATVGDGTLETFNSTSPAFLPDRVTARFNDASVTAWVRGSRVVFLDGFGRITERYGLGESVHVRVEDHNRNLSAMAIDSVTVRLGSSESGDSEVLVLAETDFDTGVYEGALPSTTGGAIGDGALDTAIHDRIFVEHTPVDGINTARAEATITGSSTTFIDASGQPAEVYLESSRLYVRVFDAEANFDSSFADSTQVRIEAFLSGDSESFFLTETGPDTSVFEGSFDMSLGPPSAGNGVVETAESAGPPFEFETLTAIHDDSEGSSSDTATTLGSRVYFIDALGRRVVSYPRGGEVHLRVEAPNRNTPGVWDTAPVTLRGPGGDEEDLVLLETSRASGVFEGAIPMDPSSPAVAFDGLLQADTGDILTAVHADVLGLTHSSATAQVRSSAIDFLDAAGGPTEELLESGPARLRVFSLGAGASPTAADEIFVDLESFYGGDSETLRLVETGADTGIFEGEMATRFASPATVGDGTLETFNSTAPSYLVDRVTARFNDMSVTVSVRGSRVFFLDEFGRITERYGQGERIYLRVRDHNRNLSPGQSDSVEVALSSLTSGDSENLTLTETGPDTGVYEGSLEGGTAAVAGDAVLGAAIHDTIRVEHAPQDMVNVARAEARITGSSIYFIDASGQKAEVYFESSRVYVRVFDLEANFDPSFADSTQVRFDAQNSGDSESLYLWETGPDTSTFEGSLELSLDPPSAANGVLETTASVGPPFEYETIVVTHDDSEGFSSDTATVEPAPPPAVSALLVVADATALTTADAAVQARLEAQGWGVLARSAVSSQATDAAGHDLVLVSSTITSGAVGSKFRDVSVPVLTWEPFLYDDMKMTGPAAHQDYGSVAAQTELAIVDRQHPLAVGLSGTPAVTTSARKVIWGRPAATAEVVATSLGNADQALLFGYEAGAAMVGLMAPARRVGFFFEDQSAENATAEAWSLFDAAVCWAVNCTGGPTARINASATSGPVGAGISLDAYPSEAGDFPIASYHWDFGDGTGQSGDYGGHTFARAGRFTVTLTVTDTAGNSDTARLRITVGAPPAVLFIANQPTLDAADGIVRRRIESLGFLVDVVSGSASQTSDAAGRALVVISGTLSSTSVNTKFRDVATPVLTWESHIFDDMKMTALGNAAYGPSYAQPGIDLILSAHPLAAGLSGQIAPSPAPMDLRFGVPSTEAAVVATLVGNPSRATIFGYEEGANMVGLQAPARRVGFFLWDDQPLYLNAAGEALLDAAIGWASGLVP